LFVLNGKQTIFIIMKKIIRVLMLSAITLGFAVASSSAQIVVRIRPNRPHGAVIVRGVAPSPRHVWVGEEWTPNGRSYAYAPGHWVEPPHPHAVWISGRWASRRGGSVWVAGHWK
jgi:hypothetical protein